VVTTVKNSSGNNWAGNFATGIEVDTNGNLYKTSYHCISKLTPAGVDTILAGSSQGLSGSSNGTGTNATFFQPQSIALGSDGILYITDTNNHLIRKVQ
jgi:hypothetical protein